MYFPEKEACSSWEGRGREESASSARETDCRGESHRLQCGGCKERAPDYSVQIDIQVTAREVSSMRGGRKGGGVKLHIDFPHAVWGGGGWSYAQGFARNHTVKYGGEGGGVGGG
jgi:hypothetical protein